jgi:hypothetical protein
MPVRFIFGKSLVGGNATSDVFEGITSSPIPYARPRGYEAPAPGLVLELGGPWAFYNTFWPAHGIEHLAKLYAPEAQAAPGESIWVPLIIRNDTDSPKQIKLHGTLPAGWSEKPDAMTYTVAAHDTYAVQLTVTSSAAQKGRWQTLTWTAESADQTIAPVSLRVDVVSNGLPQ